MLNLASVKTVDASSKAKIQKLSLTVPVMEARYIAPLSFSYWITVFIAFVSNLSGKVKQIALNRKAMDYLWLMSAVFLLVFTYLVVISTFLPTSVKSVILTSSVPIYLISINQNF